MVPCEDNFELEAQMLEPLQRWVNAQGLQSKTEFPTPWGVCDLVAVNLSPKNVAKRVKYRQMHCLGSAVRAKILLEIPDFEDGRPIRAEELEGTSGLPKGERLQRELKFLTSHKFVQKTSSDEFHKFNGWYPLHQRIVAIEMKLSRIDEVIAQARHHLAFASESYVALPMRVAQRLISTKRAYEKDCYMLGILGLSKEKCRVLRPAAVRCYADCYATQMYLVEHFWRDYLQTVKHQICGDGAGAPSIN